MGIISSQQRQVGYAESTKKTLQRQLSGLMITENLCDHNHITVIAEVSSTTMIFEMEGQ